MTLAQFKLIGSDKKKAIESVFILGDYAKKYTGGLALDYVLANYFT